MKYYETEKTNKNNVSQPSLIWTPPPEQNAIWKEFVEQCLWCVASRMEEVMEKVNDNYWITTQATLDSCFFYGGICGNLSPRGQKVTGRLTFILVYPHTHIHLYTHIYV